MADYGDTSTVKKRLGIVGSGDDARLAALNAVASRKLEYECGVTGFGTAGADRAVTFYPGGYALSLVLDPPIRSVTSITMDGAAVTSDGWRLIWPTPGGAYRGISALSGRPWGGTVVVTGQWGDQPTGAVPAEIVEAANVLVAGWFLRDRTTDGEVSGPDGMTFRPGDPMKDERVKLAVAKYRVALLGAV